MRWIALIAFVFIPVTLAYGCVTDIDISRTGVISDRNGEFRILLGLDEIGIPDIHRIDSACIVLPKRRDSAEVALEVFAVTEPWDAATVSWDYPWSKSGGAYSDTCVCTWVIQPGVGSSGHFIDLTEYVRAVMAGRTDYGLMIRPVGDSDAGFSSQEASVFSGLEYLKLRVLYRGRD